MTKRLAVAWSNSCPPKLLLNYFFGGQICICSLNELPGHIFQICICNLFTSSSKTNKLIQSGMILGNGRNTVSIVLFQRREFTESCCNWIAANGGLRDEGLRKSKDICQWGKRPFSSVFWIFQVLLAPSGKGRKKAEKGRFWPISADFQEGQPDTP